MKISPHSTVLLYGTSLMVAVASFSPFAKPAFMDNKPLATKSSTTLSVRPGLPFDAGFEAPPPVDYAKDEVPNQFQPSWPNPADFRFNYHNLLSLVAEQSKFTGIGQVPLSAPKKVAIVGAGVAGMVAARELHRSGFNVTIFEASPRIGGRLYTKPNSRNSTGGAGMELGAMRMPFFNDTDKNNSALQYFLMTEPKINGLDGVIFTPFPNPGMTGNGTNGVPGTGIYVNRGLGTNFVSDTAQPKLIPWYNGTDGPADEYLVQINQKVNNFITQFQDFIRPKYLNISSGNQYHAFWKKIVQHYDSMTFNDLVVADNMTVKQNISIEDFDGNLGGMNMTSEEASLLYTIGVGDGSWGAFYSIAALWFMRCTLFGFSTNLQTIEGFSNPESLPYYNQQPSDSIGNQFQNPVRYEGIQSLVEYLYFVSPSPGIDSLHESTSASLVLNSPVSSITKKDTDGGTPEIDVSVRLQSSSHTIEKTETFNYVLVTTTHPAGQLSMSFTGFDEDELPQQKRTAAKTQHNIASCKLFFPLTKRYWTEVDDNKIPQIIITDTYVQDVYALDWRTKTGEDAAVLLASYTWEDDSLKLSPFSEDELADLVKTKLDEITMRTVGQNMSQYIDDTKPVMFQWITQPTYIGCSKLYRAYAEADNFIDLSYNEYRGGESFLYFAGENYGVEGGWTEPAIRSSLDAVIRILNHTGSSFVSGFSYEENYPSWELNEENSAYFQESAVQAPLGGVESLKRRLGRLKRRVKATLKQ